LTKPPLVAGPTRQQSLAVRVEHVPRLIKAMNAKTVEHAGTLLLKT
jgi:hypothetical protein